MEKKYTSSQNAMRAAVSLLPALIFSLKFSPYTWAVIAAVVGSYVIAWLFAQIWTIANRWWYAVVCVVLSLYLVSIFRAIAELMMQNQPIATNLGKIFFASAIVTIALALKAFIFLLVAYFGFVLIQYLLDKAFKKA